MGFRFSTMIRVSWRVDWRKWWEWVTALRRALFSPSVLGDAKEQTFIFKITFSSREMYISTL
jgi:hypothetical protein